MRASNLGPDDIRTQELRLELERAAPLTTEQLLALDPPERTAEIIAFVARHQLPLSGVNILPGFGGLINGGPQIAAAKAKLREIAARQKAEIERHQPPGSFGAAKTPPDVVDLNEAKAAKAFEPTDDQIADIFAEQHRNDLRYVAAWGKWFEWTGRMLARRKDASCTSISSAETCKAQGVKRAGMAKMVGAVHTLARADRRLAATIEQWDTDPMLLNTPEGHCRSARRDAAQERSARLLHQDHGGRAAWRLSAVPLVPHSDHGRRQSSGRLPSADVRLLPDRRHQRTGGLFQPRWRAERQDGVDVYSRWHPRRLLPRNAHRDLHREQERPTPDRACTAARRSTGHRHRDRGWATLGREPPQGIDRRREHPRALHAQGLLRVPAASSSPSFPATTSHGCAASAPRCGGGCT